MDGGATLALVARITLAAAFAYSAAGKLANLAAFAHALGDFGVPRSGLVAPALPVVEAGLAILLVAVRDQPWPAFLATGVLAVFTGAVVASLLSGAAKPCPCFGPPGADARPVSAATVARNGCLVALAVIGSGSTDGASATAAIGSAVVTVPLTLAALRRYG
ncbi:MAG: MauE/DoxX family redox-associated membrane protein [Actinomycetota bacterium]